jgi:sortase A
MKTWKSLVSWLFLLGGVFLLLEGSSSVYPFLGSPTREVEYVPIDSTETAEIGSYVFRLTLPRLDTTLSVVEGTTTEALKKGPGHLEGTPWPGGPGNSVIAGHRDTHFRVLKDVRIGDEVSVERGGRRFVYEVTDVSIVKPEDTSSLRPTSQGVLTLITCYPFYYFGPAPDRFVVRASAISEAS